MTPDQLQAIQARTERLPEGPWFVSDCEGSLQIWRQDVVQMFRDDTGEVTGYRLPGCYSSTDLIAEWSLDTWDEGDDPDDDLRREVAEFIGHARDDVPDLVALVRQAQAETSRLRALLAEVLAEFHQPGYPGQACLRSGWIPTGTLASWHAAVSAAPAEAPHG